MSTHEIYVAGSIAFFIASGIFFVASKILLRPYHYLNYVMLTVPLIVTIAYLAMSLGYGLVATETATVNVTRYLDWIITTPIMLYILSYTLYQGSNKVQWNKFLLIASLDVLMLATGLAAEFTTGNLHTLLFSVSSLTFLALLYIIIDAMLNLHTREPNAQLKKATLGMAWTILVLWSIYPFIWIFSPQGMSALSESGVSIAFLMLDLLSKLVFSGLLLRYLFIMVKTNSTQQ